MPASSFEELLVWQKSHQLVLRVYELTRTFPKEELYGLAAQMRRASVSVPANIAEGFKRRGRSDKARIMSIAQGSLEALRYYFILADDLGYAPTVEEREAATEIGRMLSGYAKALMNPGS